MPRGVYDRKPFMRNTRKKPYHPLALQICRNHGMTMEETAFVLGVSAKTLWRWQKETPTPHVSTVTA